MKEKHYIVLDTETINVNNCLCYNLGYKILNDKGEAVVDRDFVIEQVWHNRELFKSAYYADKRPIYVSAMRGKKAQLKKWGQAMRVLSKDIKDYNVQAIWAFNCNFDMKVIDYNCEHFGTINPTDNIPFLDIRAWACKVILHDNDNPMQYCEYELFCDNHRAVKSKNGEPKFYTASGNLSTTAESFYCFLTDNSEFDEAHTALKDCLIEAAILNYCAFELGLHLEDMCDLNNQPTVKRSYTDHLAPGKKLVVKDGQKNIVFEFTGNFTIRNTKNGVSITIADDGQKKEESELVKLLDKYAHKC